MIWKNKDATNMVIQLTMRKIQFYAFWLVLLVPGVGCRSPLADVKTPDPPTLALKVTVEDHSRNLKRLRALQPGESNSAATRSATLGSYQAWLESEFRAEAKARGLAVDREANLHLELAITSLGEVRAKYIVYGIASGVAWGIGTGLVAHDPRLAVGLGLYELVEESAFWIAGSALFGAYSAPAVIEASLVDGKSGKALWKESYYILNGRKFLKDLPENQRSDRTNQLHGTLHAFLDKLFKHLEAMPGFPRREASHQAMMDASSSHGPSSIEDSLATLG